MPAAAKTAQSQAIDPHDTLGSFLPSLTSTPAPQSRPITRRANYEQGRALEVLGHAIEYLIDSHLYLVGEPATRADSEATQILMQHSRQIFSECAEVVPPIRRLKLWIAEKFSPTASC